MDKKEKRKLLVREMKNNLILDAALEVFSEKGFYETRLEDIALQAGFSKASLYNYYKDKETIFLHIALREQERLIERMDNDPFYRLSEEFSLKENYRRLLYLVFLTFDTHFAFILTLNTFQFFALLHEMECKETKSEIEREYLQIETVIHTRMEKLIKNAQEKNEISSLLSPDKLARFVDGILFGIIKDWKREEKMGDVDRSVTDIMLFLESGFGFFEEK